MPTPVDVEIPNLAWEYIRRGRGLGGEAATPLHLYKCVARLSATTEFLVNIFTRHALFELADLLATTSEGEIVSATSRADL